MINIRSCKEIGFDAGHNVMTAKLNGINVYWTVHHCNS